MISNKNWGGKRPNSGRKKGIIKGRQIVRQIQVNIDIFEELNKLKKYRKEKSWNTLFSYLIQTNNHLEKNT